ncbi:MAG: hypothetical protein WAO81_11080 [Methanosarcina flavescens]
MPAASSESLAESKHPYSNNFEYTWSNISEPGATEIRLHFSDLDIGRYDKLTILDKYGNDLVTYSGITKADFWTEWYVGDTLKVKLITGNSGTAYGFKIDKGEIKNDKNITTVFTESAKTLDPTTEKVGHNSGEDSDDLQKYMDRFHNVSVEIAVTLNILEEEDNQSWMYRNIQWVFSGIGGTLLVSIGGLMKRWKDKKSDNENSEDKKLESN